MIRVLGDQFDPEVLLKDLTIKPSSVFQKGEIPLGRNKVSMTSGFTCDVGAGSLEGQIELATNFFEIHHEDLKKIAANKYVESYFVDFGYECRLNDESVIIQRDFFPPKFIQLAGEVGVGVCLTLSKIAQ